MLLPELRFKDKKIITFILRSGTIIKDPFFNIYYKKLKAPAKVVVMVSSKVSKKAVRRNLVRRRVQEIFNKYVSQINPEFKIVISAKKDILNKKQIDIEEKIKKYLNIN